jgi:hypothetical protein
MFSYAIKILEKEIAKQYEELRYTEDFVCAHDDIRMSNILLNKKADITETINGLVEAAELLKSNNRTY